MNLGELKNKIDQYITIHGSEVDVVFGLNCDSYDVDDEDILVTEDDNGKTVVVIDIDAVIDSNEIDDEDDSIGFEKIDEVDDDDKF